MVEERTGVHDRGITPGNDTDELTGRRNPTRVCFFKKTKVDTGKRVQKFIRYGENGCSGTGPAVVGGEAAERQ